MWGKKITIRKKKEIKNHFEKFEKITVVVNVFPSFCKSMNLRQKLQNDKNWLTYHGYKKD